MEVDNEGSKRVDSAEGPATKSVRKSVEPSIKFKGNDDKTNDKKSKQLCRESYDITRTTDHKVVTKWDDEYRNFSPYSFSSPLHEHTTPLRKRSWSTER
ncbi:unnamed protein product [Peronospora belbahrii]|uniref:Uncharacterized protein n=1 Tax=Peronospora belbahrii TaxID=622444 RepID=A0AAU9L3A7_9STRA|nr:unnamed protein product [Peronospora belbahrii]